MNGMPDRLPAASPAWHGRLTHHFRPAALALVLGALAAPSARAQCQPSPSTDFWLVNGPVYAVVPTEDTIYAGGEFNYVGPQTGPTALYDVPGQTNLGPLPRINGTVNAVEPDGMGGWFVGGQFTRVSTHPINNLVHILPDLSVDESWDAGIPTTRVYALALHEGRLYIGGQFQKVGGVTQQNLAGVRASDAVLEWTPPQVAGNVYAIAIAHGLAFVGGNFFAIGSLQRQYLAAMDLATAAPTDWSPAPDQQVFAIQVAGDTVYVGGQFTSVGTKPRNRLAALDRTTAVASTWNPNPNGSVRALAVTDTAVYVGGDFTTIAAQNRRGFAGVNRTTGAGLPINLQIEGTGTPQSLVRALRIVGNSIYVGGSFSQIQGGTYPLAAAADLTTGARVAAVPLGTKFNGAQDDAAVNAIAASGTRLFFGGEFQSMGGEARSNTVALSTGTGRALPWAAAASHAVYALARGPDLVYVGGAFTTLNGVASNGLSAVDPITGAVQPQWAFTAAVVGADPVVRALLATDERLYVGGSFTSAGGSARRFLTAVDLDAGLPLSYDARLGGGSLGVSTLALYGDTLYAAGDFTTVAGQQRARLAAFSAADAAPVDWSPAPNKEVRTLAAAADRLYVGGLFTRISQIDLRNLAVFDIATRELLPWDPALPATAQGVHAIAAIDSCVYVGGQFDSIGGEYRNNLGALGPWTAAAHDWMPNPSAPPSLVSLSDQFVCVAGSFRTLGAAPNVYPLGHLAIYGRAPVILSSTLSAGKLTLEASTGDHNTAVLKSSFDLHTWTPLATTELTGYRWTVEQPIPLSPRMFYSIWAE